MYIFVTISYYYNCFTFLFLEIDFYLIVDISQNKGHKCIFNTVEVSFHVAVSKTILITVLSLACLLLVLSVVQVYFKTKLLQYSIFALFWFTCIRHKPGVNWFSLCVGVRYVYSQSF